MVAGLSPQERAFKSTIACVADVFHFLGEEIEKAIKQTSAPGLNQNGEKWIWGEQKKDGGGERWRGKESFSAPPPPLVPYFFALARTQY